MSAHPEQSNDPHQRWHLEGGVVLSPRMAPDERVEAVSLAEHKRLADITRDLLVSWRGWGGPGDEHRIRELDRLFDRLDAILNEERRS